MVTYFVKVLMILRRLGVHKPVLLEGKQLADKIGVNVKVLFCADFVRIVLMIEAAGKKRGSVVLQPVCRTVYCDRLSGRQNWFKWSVWRGRTGNSTEARFLFGHDPRDHESFLVIMKGSLVNGEYKSTIFMLLFSDRV
jgi:hypothetical protein